MPETEFTIARVWTKDGETDGRKWVRYDLQPEDDKEQRFTTFSDSIGGKAQEWLNSRVKVLYEETDRGNKIKELSLMSAAGADAKPYTKSAENPKTQRSISAAVALQQAVATVVHTIGMDADTDAITAKVTPLTRRYFALLMELSEKDKDIPF